jgi:hypothetical protein
LTHEGRTVAGLKMDYRICRRNRASSVTPTAVLLLVRSDSDRLRRALLLLGWERS